MTHDDILRMDAGGKIDACVATLLGWKHCEDSVEASAELLAEFGETMMHPPGRRADCIVFAEFVPKFSTDVKAAISVLDSPLFKDMSISLHRPIAGWWSVAIGDYEAAGTLPLAICRAALLAGLATSKGHLSDPDV